MWPDAWRGELHMSSCGMQIPFASIVCPQEGIHFHFVTLILNLLIVTVYTQAKYAPHTEAPVGLTNLKNGYKKEKQISPS